jgi:hypothetical protein
VDAGRIGDDLVAAAAGFAATRPWPGQGALTYSPLFVALAGADDVFEPAIECVYEGYLLHYRTSRVFDADVPLETRLLAGDHFDALGLRLVAGQGDLESVELLTRLMSACSWLRSAERPFAYDDDLWALTVAGMAAVRRGGNAMAVLRAFDEVDRLIARDRVQRLPQVVRHAAGAVPLRDPAPLRVALGLQADAESITPAVSIRDADLVEPHEAAVILAEEQLNDPGGLW